MLNKKQEVWIGVYNGLPMPCSQFFFRRIAQGKIPFITNGTTIVFEEIKKHAVKAKILKRGDKFPTATVDGSVIKSVTPEVIKDSVSFTPYDSLNRQPGQQVYVNGKKINNEDYERDRRMSTLKSSISSVQEEIAASVFLQAKYVSPDTKNEVTYTPYKKETIAKTEIKDWGLWTAEVAGKFQKETKMRVDEILVGSNIFYAILSEYNNQKKVMTATPSRVETADGDYELHLNIFGFTYILLPPATDTDGTEIITENWFQLRNNSAVIPAFAGVVNVENGQSTLEGIDVLIRETNADQETGEAKTLAESAYCPIVVNSNAVLTYEITGL